MLIKRELFEAFFDLPSQSKYYDDLSMFNLFSSINKALISDRIVYAWRQEINSRSNDSFDNVAELVKFYLTVPLYLYEKFGNSQKEMLNRYILERLEWIVSNHFISKNEQKFANLLAKYALEDRDIYIYGKSEVGVRLKRYLAAHNIKVEGFIDDMRKGEDSIELDAIKDSKKSLVIIATYKPNIILKLYKKLTRRFKKVEIVELFNDV